MDGNGITIPHQLLELLITIGVAGLLGKGGYSYYQSRWGAGSHGTKPVTNPGTNAIGVVSDSQLREAVRTGCAEAMKPQTSLLKEVRDNVKDLCDGLREFMTKEEARREMEMQLKIQKLGRRSGLDTG